MSKIAFLFVLILSMLLCGISPAHAYIGPGLGLAAIGLILGILISILLAILAIFWYPIKRLFKRLRGSGTEEDEDEER